MKNKWKTCYEGHDGAYRYHKANGGTGWGDGVKEYEYLLEETFKAGYVPKSGKLLELGCGAGETALWFAEKGYESYGVDISQTAIEWAKEKAVEQNSNADFRVGSVLDLKDYPDNFFDFVFDAHCFHCIIGKDRKLFLESALRVLKPGGFFLSNTMCGEFILEEGSEKNYVYDPESRCLVTKGFAQRYIGLPNDIIKEIKDAGFKILDTNVNTDDIQDMLRVHATKE